VDHNFQEESGLVLQEVVIGLEMQELTKIGTKV
jgi:hypothetical protein